MVAEEGRRRGGGGSGVGGRATAGGGVAVLKAPPDSVQEQHYDLARCCVYQHFKAGRHAWPGRLGDCVLLARGHMLRVTYCADALAPPPSAQSAPLRTTLPSSSLCWAVSPVLSVPSSVIVLVLSFCLRLPPTARIVPLLSGRRPHRRCSRG